MSVSAKHDELERLRAQVRELESEIAVEESLDNRRALRDYPTFHATAGCMLGLFGAAASLLFNVIGAAASGRNPLELIRVYLTFPLGENALRLTEQAQAAGAYAVGDGLILAFGCTLYLLTGMVLGIPVMLAIRWVVPRGDLAARAVVASLAALAIWAFNFYLVLSWLQPLVLGGRWIVDGRHLPWWVAAATHVVFGVTIAVLYPLVRVPSAQSPEVAARV